MGKAYHSTLFLPVLVTLTDLEIPRLGFPEVNYEKYEVLKQKILTSPPSWVCLLPSPLGYITLTLIPYSLGMGKALAPSSQYNKWGQIQVLGQENWTPPPHFLELLRFLLSMGTTEAIERGNGVITQ